MTLNILFLTITIKTRQVSPEMAMHNQKAKEAYEHNKNRALTVHRLY